MSEALEPKPPAYYVRADLENGGFTTLARRTAQDALTCMAQFKAQGLKVTVTKAGGAPVSEAQLQAIAAREAAN